MASDTALTVPSCFVPYLRSGLIGEWGFIAEEASRRALTFGSNASEHLYREPREAFYASCELLDAIGWSNTSSQTDVEIDLAMYYMLVVKALRGAHGVLVDQLEERPKEDQSDVLPRVEALGDFVKVVERRVRRLGYRQTEGPSARSASPAGTPQA
jgi:hypothetical protein